MIFRISQRNYRTLLSAFILLFVLSPVFIFAQIDVSDNSSAVSTLKINKWSITVNGGATLLWGDLSDEPSNPFQKYFSPQQGIGYGIMLSRRLGNTININLEYLGGNLQGFRSFWSNGDTANLSFNSKLNDININVEVDLLNLLLKSKERRLFSAYLKGGIGYVFYKPTVYHTNDGSLVSNTSGSCIEIPWGWGVKSDISKHWTVRFENTFHHAMKDDVDGHGTIYSHANDIYNYTSLGITYRIYQKPKQPKLPKEEIVPSDTILAQNKTEEKTPFELSIAANYPSKMLPFDTSDVTLRISKGDIKGGAKLQQTIPQGFAVEELESSGAGFEFKNQIVTYRWDSLPDAETLELTYRLITKDAPIGTHSIPGILFYQQNNEDQIRQFKKNIEVKAENIIAKVAASSNKSDEIKTVAATTVKEENDKSKSKESTQGKDLIYRVQVYAVYGGTTSSRLLEKRLSLDYPVKQDYQGNYAKYTCGEFATYEEAAAYKKKLRASTVPGAFVVGFYNGKRTKNIHEAISIENGGVSASPSFTKGIVYSIQILASSKDIDITTAKAQTGCSFPVVKVYNNGLYKYQVGQYSSYQEAKRQLAKVRSEVSDAFIVKYKDGKRI